MTKWLPVVIAAILLGVGGVGYYFKDDVLDKVDPDHNRHIGEKYFGGKKTKRRKHKKGKKGKSIKRKY